MRIARAQTQRYQIVRHHTTSQPYLMITAHISSVTACVCRVSRACSPFPAIITMVGMAATSTASTLLYSTYTSVYTSDQTSVITEEDNLEYSPHHGSDGGVNAGTITTTDNNSVVYDDNNGCSYDYEHNPYINSLILSVVYAVVFFAALVTNTLVLFVVSRKPKLRSPSNIHLSNLALADLFCSMTVPFAVLSQLEKTWMLNSICCQIVAFLTVWSCLNIVLILIFISVYRFFVITRARSKIVKNLRKRCVLFNMAIWPISALFASPPFLGFGSYQDCVGLPGCFLDLKRSRYYVGFFALISGFVPFIVMVFCYSRIFAAVRKSSKRVKNVAHALFRANSAIVLSTDNAGVTDPNQCDTPPLEPSPQNRKSRGSILELEFLPLPFGRSPRGSDASTSSAVQAAAARAEKRMSVVSYSSAMANMRPDELRLGKSLFLVFVTFIMFWLPVVAIMLVESFNKSKTPYVGFWVAMHLCIYTHATLNPLVYGLLRVPFRKALASICCKEHPDQSGQTISGYRRPSNEPARYTTNNNNIPEDMDRRYSQMDTLGVPENFNMQRLSISSINTF